MNKTIIIAIIGVLVVGGGSFYAGMKYDQNKITADRQARMQQFTGGNGGQRGARTGGGLPSGGGFTAGEIIAKDDKSITVKLRDGGSKIIFLADQTPVLKSAAGTSDDLTVGANVTINGKPNQDGSISAESIQIRP